MAWWYNLKTGKVEPDKGAPNSERMGPYETEEEAAHAMELARKRNDEWAEGDDEWDGGSSYQQKEV